VLVLLWAIVPGCRKHSGDGAPPSATSASETPASSARPGVASIAEAMAAADLRVEAKRGTTNAFEPLTEKHRAELEAHFKGPVPFPLAYQVVAVGSGRRAVLFQATEGEARPLVWLLDGDENILWAKERPTGGVKPGVTEISLASGPDGHVCLAWCNAATDSVALRRWADDGGAFADYEVVHVDTCSALSLIYWPSRGWVVAVAWPGGASFELISENGALSWGREGVSLPWTFLAAAPVSLALDTIDSVMFFRLGQSSGPTSVEYLFATRFSAEGRPLWPGPLSLKRLDRPVADPATRVLVTPGPEGSIRAALLRSATQGDAEVVVDVASDGTVLRH